MCIGLEYPTLRFFARTTRPGAGGRLAVHVNFRTPDGVARVIAFMVSDEADHLRGAVFTR